MSHPTDNEISSDEEEVVTVTTGKRHAKTNRKKHVGVTPRGVLYHARRKGILSMGSGIPKVCKRACRQFAIKVMRDAITYTVHRGKKTVTAGDVIHALKLNGRPMYGFGE